MNKLPNFLFQRKGSLFLFLSIVIILSLSCCERRYDQGESTLKEQMRGTQSLTASLYFYVWDNEKFLDKNNEKPISQLIKNLEDNFHAVDSLGYDREPGFRATLNSQKQLLKEIRSNFDTGRKNFAKQGLRSLSSNCIACHTRSKISEDFFGSPAPIKTNSLENKFTAAEYLFATRQFNKSNTALINYINQIGKQPFASAYAMNAVELLLTVNVRALENYNETAKVIEELLKNFDFEPEDRKLLHRWVIDLKELSQVKTPAQPLLREALHHLGDNFKNRTYTEDRLHLVKSLRASAILHNYLRGVANERKKAVFTMAHLYNHLPVDELEALADLQIEEAIIEFPGSDEAKEVFAIYEKNKKELYGLNIPKEVRNRIEELRILSNKPIEAQSPE